MGAPTNAALVKKVLANSEPSTHEGKADVTSPSSNTSLMTRSHAFWRSAKPVELRLDARRKRAKSRQPSGKPALRKPSKTCGI